MASKFTYHVDPRFSLYGKLGLALLVYEEKYSTGFRRDEDWSKVVGTYGFGAQLKLSRV
ncbi:MAG: opacity protein-like surface antigen [Gammaproteobacteria bacterium]|jgi:opacity protein-like surface antigen